MHLQNVGGTRHDRLLQLGALQREVDVTVTDRSASDEDVEGVELSRDSLLPAVFSFLAQEGLRC